MSGLELFVFFKSRGKGGNAPFDIASVLQNGAIFESLELLRCMYALLDLVMYPAKGDMVTS